MIDWDNSHGLLKSRLAFEFQSYKYQMTLGLVLSLCLQTLIDSSPDNTVHPKKYAHTGWRNEMETISALLALCEENALTFYLLLPWINFKQTVKPPVKLTWRHLNGFAHCCVLLSFGKGRFFPYPSGLFHWLLGNESLHESKCYYHSKPELNKTVYLLRWI